jgi:hypothetical protein
MRIYRSIAVEISWQLAVCKRKRRRQQVERNQHSRPTDIWQKLSSRWHTYTTPFCAEGSYSAGRSYRAKTCTIASSSLSLRCALHRSCDRAVEPRKPRIKLHLSRPIANLVHRYLLTQRGSERHATGQQVCLLAFSATPVVRCCDGHHCRRDTRDAGIRPMMSTLKYEKACIR